MKEAALAAEGRTATTASAPDFVRVVPGHDTRDAR
jgi:hypothetical protein